MKYNKEVFMEIIDTINSFVIESRRNLSEYDKYQFENSCSAITEGFLPFKYDVGNIVRRSVDNDIAYMNRAMGYLDTLGELDFVSMSTFFSQVYASLDTSKYKVVLMNDNEIEKIRPDYLENVSLDFDSWASNILSNNKTMDDIRDTFIQDSYFDRLKKQLAKTSLSVNKLKDLMKWTIYLPTAVSKDCIRNNILPFLSKAPQTITELKSTANHIINVLGSTCRKIMDTHNSVMSTINSGTLSSSVEKNLLCFEYNFLRRYLNLCSFLTGMGIRKICYMSYNSKSIITLQNEIKNTANLQFAESVFSGTIDGISDEDLLNSIINKGFDLVLPCVHSAIERKRVEIVNTVNNIRGYNVTLSRSADTDRYPYDNTPYKAIDDMVRIVLDGIKEITVNVAEPNSVLDEVVCCSKLDKFPAMFSETLRKKIPDVSFYKCQMDCDVELEDKEVTMCIYSELTEFEFLASHVSSSLRSGFQEIEMIIGSFDVDDHGLDPVTHTELKGFLENLRTNYKDFVISAARALIQRVNNLIDIFNSKDTSPDTVPNITSMPQSPLETIDIPYSYSFDAYEAEYDDIEYSEKLFFESELREYNAMVNKRDRGVTIMYEETQTVSNTGSTEPSVSGAKPESKPNENKTDNNQNSNNSTTVKNNSGTENKKSLIDRFKEWIQKILEDFRGKSRRLSKRNNAWLASVKDDILSLDYSNINITLAPYKNADPQTVVADTNASAAKIRALNAKALPDDIKSGGTRAERYLFPHIPEKCGNSSEFGSRISYFMTYGEGTHGNLVKFSGDDAKNKVISMISFCEGYEKTYKTVASALDGLSKAALDKQGEIVGGSTTTESAIFEANDVKVNGTRVTGENEKTVDSSTILTSKARAYTGQVLTVIEKQYLDYIKTLDKLAPKKNNEPANSQNDANNTKNSGDQKPEENNNNQ